MTLTTRNNGKIIGETYVPGLPPTAFVPMPEGTEALPGSPTEFHFPLFAIPELPRMEQEEAAGRLLTALALHGSWDAIVYEELVYEMRAEYIRHRENDPAGTF